MALTKPPVRNNWGNTNTTSADMVDPGGLNNTGFLPPPTVPDREHFNFMLNYLTNAVRYYSSRGIPEWDASETQYAVGSQVQYLAVLYACSNASVAGTNPSVDTAHWSPLLAVGGTLLRRTVITASGSLASIAGCKRATFRMVGSGGGGAGAYGRLSPVWPYGGGGGSSGSWGEFETTVIPVNWSYTVGALGAGGAAPGSDQSLTAGSNGGDVVLTDGTNTFTCFGGVGAGSLGEGGSMPAAPTASPGGLIRLSSAGDGGGCGTTTTGTNAATALSGKGGSSPFGAGGRGRSGDLYLSTGKYVAGTDGKGNGSGGGGALSMYSSSTVDGPFPRKGGDGTAGLILLEEWS